VPVTASQLTTQPAKRRSAPETPWLSWEDMPETYLLGSAEKHRHFADLASTPTPAERQIRAFAASLAADTYAGFAGNSDGTSRQQLCRALRAADLPSYDSRPQWSGSPESSIWRARNPWRLLVGSPEWLLSAIKRPQESGR